jgi:putative transposase
LSDYRRSIIPGGTFFFTVVTHMRRPIFADDFAVEIFFKCIREISALHPFTIEAWVVLPDHIHMIWTLPEDDSDYSTRWKKIKARFSRQYLKKQGTKGQEKSPSMTEKGEKGIWQRRFWEHSIRDQEDFNRHCDYIHYNPVKHGMVTLPFQWQQSSLMEFVQKGSYSPEWEHTIERETADVEFE